MADFHVAGSGDGLRRPSAGPYNQRLGFIPSFMRWDGHLPTTGTSFNGRTPRSGRGYRGANPCVPATHSALGLVRAGTRERASRRDSQARRERDRIPASQPLAPKRPIIELAWAGRCPRSGASSQVPLAKTTQWDSCVGRLQVWPPQTLRVQGEKSSGPAARTCAAPGAMHWLSRWSLRVNGSRQATERPRQKSPEAADRWGCGAPAVRTGPGARPWIGSTSRESVRR